MASITAIVLSKAPIEREIPGVLVLPYISSFQDASGLLESRLAAIRKVETDWFFCLDDDDELPEDYLRVLSRCVSVDTPLAYTDELILHWQSSQHIRRRSKPYSQDEHIKDFTLIHHLAVCRTDAAIRAMDFIPRGAYGFENLLFFQVAKEGATYIDEVGYIWNRKKSGLSNHPSMLNGMVQSATWAHRNRN